MQQDVMKFKGIRLGSLTGVRFPALFLVFANHIGMGFPMASMDAIQNYQSYAGWIGKAGLSLFFMLSGFILTWIARDGESTLLFWRRRFVRVLPLHWVTFALSLAIFAYPAVSGKAATLNFFTLASWSKDPEVFSSMNAPSWSLTCLTLFYLSFPALHRVAKRIPAKYLWWCAGAVVATVISITVVVRAVVPADPLMAPASPSSSLDAFYFIQTFPLSRIFEFFLGILLARVILTGQWFKAGRPLPLLGLLLAGFVVASQLPRDFRLVAAMIIPIFLFLGGLAAADIAGRKTILATRPMQWMGDISFAFYLIHWPVIMFFFKAFGIQRTYSIPEFIGASTLCLAVSVFLAWLLTIGVERPIVRLLSKPRSHPPRDSGRGTPQEPVVETSGSAAVR